MLDENKYGTPDTNYRSGQIGAGLSSSLVIESVDGGWLVSGASSSGFFKAVSPTMNDLLSRVEQWARQDIRKETYGRP